MNWKRTFYAILAAQVITIAAFDVSMPIIPFYLQELGARGIAEVNFWNGLTQAGAAIMLAIFSPIWGSLADYYGRKKMLLRATLGGCVVLGLLALATAPWHVFALRMIQGCLTGTVAAATVLTSSVVPEKKVGFCLGVLTTSIFVGAATGPLLGGLISDYVGHRANFLVTSFLLFISALIILLFVREDFTPVKGTQGFLKKAMPDLSVITSIPSLMPLFLILFTIQLSGSIVNPVVPLYIQWLTPDAEKVATVTGIILSFSALASALSAAIIGSVSDRFGYRRTLALCMIGAIVFYVPQGLVSGWIGLFIFRIIGGIFLGGTMPSVNALLAQRTPREKRGAVFGLSASFSSTGNATGPAIGAVAAASAGYRSVFFITAALLTLAGISMALRKKNEANYAKKK